VVPAETEAGAAKAPSIWVDADACPGVIKDILFRAAERAAVAGHLVANAWIRTPPSRWIKSIQVPGGFDVADAEIVRRIGPGDLVVTQDIPLAAPRDRTRAPTRSTRAASATPATPSRQRLSMRNFMDELRGSGVDTGGPAPFHARDRMAFANALDGWLAETAPLRVGPPAPSAGHRCAMPGHVLFRPL
jgi:uncharacterized protein YaiI (UPF0178 family)